jgi:hypothetical protein
LPLKAAKFAILFWKNLIYSVFYHDVEDSFQNRLRSASPSLHSSNSGEAGASPSLMASPPMIFNMYPTIISQYSLHSTAFLKKLRTIESY